MAYYFVRVRGALASQFSWLSARAVDRGRGDAWVNLTLRRHTRRNQLGAYFVLLGLVWRHGSGFMV